MIHEQKNLGQKKGYIALAIIFAVILILENLTLSCQYNKYQQHIDNAERQLLTLLRVNTDLVRPNTGPGKVLSEKLGILTEIPIVKFTQSMSGFLLNFNLLYGNIPPTSLSVASSIFMSPEGRKCYIKESEYERTQVNISSLLKGNTLETYYS